MARCDSYDLGECTWGACQQAGWVRDGWGNANQWCDRAAAQGFVLTDVPTVNAVVCFAPGGLYDPTYGHLAVVLQAPSYQRFLVVEMNYSAWNRYNHRWATRANVQAFILPLGFAPGQGGSGIPVPDLSPLAGFGLAWARLQNFWNVEIEQHVWAVQAIAGQLRDQALR